MVDEITKQGIQFEDILKAAMSIPWVNINRKDFIKREFRKYGSIEQASRAVDTTPKEAGFSDEVIVKVAKGCINYETGKASAISAAAGLPGGFVIIGTVPADLAQYYAHILRILQKLVYIYGWDDLRGDDGKFDDETMDLLLIFLGVMFGVDQAVIVINKFSAAVTQTALKRIPRMALTKTAYYPVIKKIAGFIGVNMNKTIFAKGVAKVVPVIGAITSGGLTLVTFRPMALRLDSELRKIALKI